MFSVSLLSRLFVAVSHSLCKISDVNVWVSFEISRERCWHSRWEFLHKQGKLLIGPTWISFYQMYNSHVGLAVWPEDLGKDLVRSYSSILDRWSMVCWYLLKCHGLVKPSEYQQGHIRMKHLTFLSASFHYVSVHFSWKLNSVDFAELASNLYKIETSALAGLKSIKDSRKSVFEMATQMLGAFQKSPSSFVSKFDRNSCRHCHQRSQSVSPLVFTLSRARIWTFTC